jgi:hypothetical protein
MRISNVERERERERNRDIKNSGGDINAATYYTRQAKVYYRQNNGPTAAAVCGILK